MNAFAVFKKPDGSESINFVAELYVGLTPSQPSNLRHLRWTA